MKRFGGAALWITLFGTTACGASDGERTGGAGGESAGGEGGNESSSAGTSPGSEAGMGGAVQPAIGDLEDSADSVVVTLIAGRADPEGVAAKSPQINELSWRDARGAVVVGFATVVVVNPTRSGCCRVNRAQVDKPDNETTTPV